MRVLTPGERDDLLALVRTARAATFDAAEVIDQSTVTYPAELHAERLSNVRAAQLAEDEAYEAIARWVFERTGDPSPLELILHGGQEVTA